MAVRKKAAKKKVAKKRVAKKKVTTRRKVAPKKRVTKKKVARRVTKKKTARRANPIKKEYVAYAVADDGKKYYYGFSTTKKAPFLDSNISRALTFKTPALAKTSADWALEIAFGKKTIQDLELRTEVYKNPKR